MAGNWPGGWVTGFCAIKHCEGTKPKGILSGTPMKTCMRGSEMTSGAPAVCKCACHVKIDKMYEMLDMVRVVTQNPDYKPVERTWVMPTTEERMLQRESSNPSKPAPVVMPSIMPDVLPPTVVVTRNESASGHRVKGALEDEVKQVTDLWVALKPKDPCTPAWVAEKINAENPPSTGAISAVFDRWAEYGFASTEKKPTRFTGYTEAGVKKGLYVLKAEFKDKKRRQMSALTRR